MADRPDVEPAGVRALAGLPGDGRAREAGSRDRVYPYMNGVVGPPAERVLEFCHGLAWLQFVWNGDTCKVKSRIRC
ncbi:hypothetical protein Psi02_76650 [Planotetraspora silvatica]|uniref:Uncharacterized protein n=1 Tax=Planotetraspora silvatica TaxID=234614 RepID=A0A8J3UXF6_9ACTN|nr:hypothetical protein Psi02_76650 [Planotetraspora silvatica]